MINMHTSINIEIAKFSIKEAGAEWLTRWRLYGERFNSNCSSTSRKECKIAFLVRAEYNTNLEE
jgi:hypothetical protein